MFTGPTQTITRVHVGGSGGNPSSPNTVHKFILGHSISRGLATSASFQTNTEFFGFSNASGESAPAPQITTVIDPNQSTTLVVLGPGGPITVDIPAGTFSQFVTLTLDGNPNFSLLRSNIATLRGTGIGLNMSVEPNLQPRKPIRISITYRDSDIQGLQENRLRTARFIESENRWVPLNPLTDETDSNVITIQTFGVGFFQVAEMLPAASIGNAFVFPNPFRPSLGHTQVRMTNLPANAQVFIFNLRGDQIRELRTNDAGEAIWDVKNENGRGVASGVYLVLAKNGNSTQTLKVAVER